MSERRPYRRPTVRSVPRPPATDAELVQRTLAGDRAAWGELYIRFRRLVAKELGRVLWRSRRREAEDLDEAIQEWWAYECLNVFRAWDARVARLSTFLTIRANSWATHYLDRLQPGFCGRGRSSRDPVRVAWAKAGASPVESPRPDHVLERQDLRDQVRRAALSCAPTRRDRTIVLRRLLDVDEPTAQDLASELGITHQRVHQLEDRLLERMRPRLAHLAAA